MVLRLIGKRLMLGVLTLMVASLITFALVHLQKGSPGAIISGMGATKSQIWKVDEQLGWHQPLWQQFSNWLVGLIHGDLGHSFIDGRDLSQEIFTRISVTAALALGAVIALALIGVSVGIVGAVRGGWVDRMLNSWNALIFALPPYWLAVLLVLVFAVLNPLLPATGFVAFSDSPTGWAQSLILPVMAMAIPGAAGLARATRAAILEAFAQEHMRTLRAMGVPRWRIIYKHSLRFASVPVVSMIGLHFVFLFGGTVTIEQLFVLPGLGQGATAAIGQHDIPQIQATVIITTLVVVVTNLITEIASAYLDPKVRVR